MSAHRRKAALALGLALAILVPLVAWAGIDLEAYHQAKTNTAGAPTVYRSALSGADAVDVSSPLSAGSLTKECASNPNVGVSARFSTAGANVDLIFVRYHRTTAGVFTVYSTERVNVTAKASSDGTLFFADNEDFDTAGATRYEVRVGAPSAGTVTLVTVRYGVSTQ